MFENCEKERTGTGRFRGLDNEENSVNFVVTLVQTHRNGFSSRTTQHTECQLRN